MYIFKMIQRMKSQSKEILEVAYRNLRCNNFSLLPENVLYSMVVSDEIEIMEAGLKKIISVR